MFQLSKVKKNIKLLVLDLKEHLILLIHKKNISRLLKEKNSIFFLPSIDWSVPLYQRPQHFAVNFSHYFFVIYSTLNLTDDKVKSLFFINSNLVITSVWRYFLRRITNSRIYLTSTQAVNTTEELKFLKNNHNYIIYDYLDHFDEKISGSEKTTEFVKTRHNQLINQEIPDLILCSSKALFNEIKQKYDHNKILYLPNGVDHAHFFRKNVKKRKKSEIINVVYFGAIAPWLDYKLINKVAKKYSKIKFFLIGPDYNNSLSNIDFNISNITYMGTVEYSQLPKHIKFADVAIIPFSRGKVAKATSPLKLFEYLAAGLPVVVTEDMDECKRIEGVFVSKNSPSDFYAKLTKANEFSVSEKNIETIKNYALENDWKRRVEAIVDKLNNVE